MWNQTTALMAGSVVLSAFCMSAIHAALSPPTSVDAVSPIRIGLPALTKSAWKAWKMFTNGFQVDQVCVLPQL